MDYDFDKIGLGINTNLHDNKYLYANFDTSKSQFIAETELEGVILIFGIGTYYLIYFIFK